MYQDFVTGYQHFFDASVLGTISRKRGFAAPRCCSVENIGFEPITSSLPAKRSSQMS